MSGEALWVLVLLAGLFGGILSGFPVIFILAGVPLLTALGASASGHFDAVLLQAVPQRIFGILENSLLIAVPLFILMGVLLDRSRQAERMLGAVHALMRESRRGLALSVLAISLMIAACTGVVGATIAALASISLPALLRNGVDRRTASGLVCASGTLGQIVPPSIVLILLGDQIASAHLEAQRQKGNFAAEPVTIADLFAGALLPGLLLALLYGIYLIWRLRRSEDGPGREERQQQTGTAMAGTGVLTAVATLLPGLGLILAVLGSILAGIATPTEAAAIGAGGTMLIAAANLSPLHARTAGATVLAALLLLGIAHAESDLAPLILLRQLLVGLIVLSLAWHGWQLAGTGWLYAALRETVEVSGMIFGIVIGATILALVFRGLGGDGMIGALLDHIPGGATGLLIATMLVIFLLGFLLEFVEIIYIVVPIAVPVLLLQSDVSPVWLAVMIALNLQTSFLTPPFGFALFYFRPLAPAHISTMDIYRGVAPFIVLQLLALMLVAVFPALATWLPGLLPA